MSGKRVVLVAGLSTLAMLAAMWFFPAHEQRIAQAGIALVGLGIGSAMVGRVLESASGGPVPVPDPFAPAPQRWVPRLRRRASVRNEDVPHDFSRLLSHVELAQMSEFSAVASLRPWITKLAEGRALDERGTEAASRLLSINGVHDARRHGHGLTLVELDGIVSGLERAGAERGRGDRRGVNR